jgi:hypothetical protein
MRTDCREAEKPETIPKMWRRGTRMQKMPVHQLDSSFQYSVSVNFTTLAKKVSDTAPKIRHDVYNPDPNTPTDNLFTNPLLESELKKEIGVLDPDKASGADGLSNRMIQHTGPIFRCLLFDLFSMIWVGDAHPLTWQNSLLQPILKKG